LIVTVTGFARPLKYFVRAVPPPNVISQTGLTSRKNSYSFSYISVNLYELKTYHEVVDEIYYKVNHLEPWEKGSRRTSGQTGMCGGVRGVGAGGIVSTAYCLLYKLFTLKLTRKQLNGLINHCDSPYIRALGFMYIRYTLPPKDLLEWYEPYLEDEEVRTNR
jgi:pre-mRNA-splicing factor 38B